jgi:hypothetical protein
VGNAWYYSVQSVLCCHLLSRSVNSRTYRTIILPNLYGCKSLTLEEECKLRVFENRVLRRIL